MNRWLGRVCFAACILFLGNTVTVQRAAADFLVTDISGRFDLSLSSPPPTPTINMINGTVGFFPSTLTGRAANEVLDVTTYAFDPVTKPTGSRAVDLFLSGTTPSPSTRLFQFFGPVDTSPQEADLRISGAILASNDPASQTATLVASVTLALGEGQTPTTLISGLDFSQYQAQAGGGVLVMNLTGVAITPTGDGVVLVPLAPGASATFSITPVPAPASLVLVITGLPGIALLAGFRRVRRRRLPAAA